MFPGGGQIFLIHYGLLKFQVQWPSPQ